MNNLQRVLLSFGVPLALGGAFLAYIVSQANEAKVRVHAFCGTVEVGANIEGLGERAKAAELEVHEFDTVDGKGASMIQDGVLLSRHFCTVTHEQGRVVRVEPSAAE